MNDKNINISDLIASVVKGLELDGWKVHGGSDIYAILSKNGYNIKIWLTLDGGLIKMRDTGGEKEIGGENNNIEKND
jgi:hypothetical protein